MRVSHVFGLALALGVLVPLGCSSKGGNKDAPPTASATPSAGPLATVSPPLPSASSASSASSTDRAIAVRAVSPDAGAKAPLKKKGGGAPNHDTEGAAFGSGGMKGPFKKGGSVLATNLNAPGQSVQTTFLDDDGHYALVVPWKGATLLEARGLFVDEFTGAVTSLDEPLSAITNAESGKPLASSINILTTISASMLRSATTAAPARQIGEAEVDATNQLVAQAVLGEPALDVTKLNLGDRSDRASVHALQFQLAVAATAGMAHVVKAADQFGAEISSHAKLGSFAGDVVNAPTLEGAMNELRVGRTITVTTATGTKVQVPVAEVLNRIPQASFPRP